MHKANILIVDDEKDICMALNILLSKEGYTVKEAYNGEQALERIKMENFDLVMTDIKMDKMDGFAVLREAQKFSPETSVVMMTAFASVGSAVEAMRSGASDYITKPFINDEIRLTISRILQSRQLQMENQILRQELSQRQTAFKDIIGSSESMQKVFSVMEKVIPNKSNILITGESGTGKGLVAQAIHEAGPRKDKPFIAINCGAIPETLLESELFGHKKGAFTSANEDKKGLITMAHSGTLFLDEIGELPQVLQVKLLHVIQTRELTPVGDTRVITVDVRIISATNADLMQRVKEGRFREDLYYRLNVIEIHMPSLRDRRDDIPVLIKHFMQVFAKDAGKLIKDIDYEAMQALLAYDWPGNIRELRNTIERATVLADGEMITIHDLTDKFRTLDIEGV
jgi:DNA-binding NtrC family response regulator